MLASMAPIKSRGLAFCSRQTVNLKAGTEPKDAKSLMKKSCLAAGLWLNIPDYDAPTQLVKPKERNTRYVDAVLTIPKVQLHNCWLLSRQGGH